MPKLASCLPALIYEHLGSICCKTTEVLTMRGRIKINVTRIRDFDGISYTRFSTVIMSYDAVPLVQSIYLLKAMSSILKIIC